MKEEKTLNESIIDIRVELQKKNLKKSGENKYAGFDYFELADFLPTLNELMQKERINDVFSIQNDVAQLTLIKGEEKQVYTIPFVIFDTPLTYKKNKSGEYMLDSNGNYIQVASMQDIQYLGALNTYYKRYLYLNAFGITDGDVIDSMNNDDLKAKKKEEKQDTTNYRELLIKYCEDNLIDMNEIATKYKLNSKSNNKEFEKVYFDLTLFKEK